MSTLATRETLTLDQYKPQGIGHIVKLCAITTAGMVLVSAGGSILFAAPLAIATVYQMFRNSNRAKDPDWIQSRDELWNYKLSPKHRSIADDYKKWCEQWGVHTINRLIEPMIGNCTIANFTKDRKHPYYGLRGVLIYDHADDDIPPLTPHGYISCRLKERESVLNRDEQAPIDVDAKAIPADVLASGEVTENLQSAYKFLLSLTTKPLQPVIIAGLPGSGKGILAAIALSFGVLQNGLKFWVFNCKAQLSEAGYWNRSEKHFLKDRLQHDDDLFADLMDVLEQFSTEGTRRNSNPGEYPPFVLLLEEINALTGLLTQKQRQLFKSKITALASLLRSSNMAIWMSGQSITLEDLGLSGKSNRSMFTAIVACGTEREAVGDVCKMLGISFDNSKLNPDQRYWLTATGSYAALPAPANIPQFQSWSDVPNLIDLRPGATADPSYPPNLVDSLLADVEGQEQAISTAKKPPIIQDEPRSVVKKLEDSYKINAADEFNTEKTLTGLDDVHEDVAAYILERGECSIGSIKNWGKNRRKGTLSADDVDEILINLLDLQLIETFNPPESKAEFVRWIATR